MKIFSVSQRGTFHTNHNEDFLITQEIGTDKLLIAVMDGCSMGTGSHFATTLTGKLLRKIGVELHYRNFIFNQPESLTETLRSVMESLFEGLKKGARFDLHKRKVHQELPNDHYV